MRVEHRYFLVNGLRLHALDHGGEGRPIILLHGVTGHCGAWRDVAAPLSLWGRVLALDLRGHGSSQWSKEAAYGTDHHVADVAALIAGLGAGEPADVVGLSWGGLIGLRLARHHPDLLRRLVVVDPPLASQAGTDAAPPAQYHFDRHEEVRAWERAAHPRASATMLEHLATVGTRPGEAGVLSRCYDPYFNARWPFRVERFEEDWATASVPAMVVRAAGSGAAGEEDFAMVAAQRPGIRAEVLADAGQTVVIDNPLGLSDLLVDFLGDGGLEDIDLGQLQPAEGLEGV